MLKSKLKKLYSKRHRLIDYTLISIFKNKYSSELMKSAENIMTRVEIGHIDNSQHECACGNLSLKTFSNVKGANLLYCDECQTYFSDHVALIREAKDNYVIPEQNKITLESASTWLNNHLKYLSSSPSSTLLTVSSFKSQLNLKYKSIVCDEFGLINIDDIEFNSVLIPDLSLYTMSPVDLIQNSLRLLVKGGTINIRFLCNDIIDLLPENMNGSSNIAPSHIFWYFSPEFLNKTLDKLGCTNINYTIDRNGLCNVRATKNISILDVAVFPGIGDTLWSFVLAKSLLKKYKCDALNCYVHDTAGAAVSRRSNALLERFDFVRSVIPANFHIHTEPAIDPDTGYPNYVPAGRNIRSKEMPWDYNFFVNTYLEHGLDFANIAKLLALPQIVDYSIFDSYKVEPDDCHAADKITEVTNNNYVIFYMSSRIANTTAGFNMGELWTKMNWLELAQKLIDKTGVKIVCVGAHYDLDYLRDVMKVADKSMFNHWINIVGQTDIVETVEILRRARFSIGYPAGMPITSVYLGVPTVMFWRPQNLSYSPSHKKAGFCREFATSWIPPLMIEQNKYIPCWFGEDTPDTVYKKMENYNWFK